MRLKNALIVAAAVQVALVVASVAAAQSPHKPLIDVKKNPGCGVTEPTREAKLERNRRIAEFYFQSYVDAPKNKRVYTWGEYGCIAPNATVIPGTYEPVPKELPLPPDNRFMVTKEQEVYWKVMPDWAPIAGTLVVYSTEDGAFYRMRAGGHTADGKLHSFWEVDLIRINDSGQITHWEFWDDTVGLSDIFQLMFHKDFKQFSSDSYYQMIESAPTESGGKPDQQQK